MVKRYGPLDDPSVRICSIAQEMLVCLYSMCAVKLVRSMQLRAQMLV